MALRLGFAWADARVLHVGVSICCGGSYSGTSRPWSTCFGCGGADARGGSACCGLGGEVAVHALCATVRRREALGG